MIPNAVITMLEKYHCRTDTDYTNALKEIFQEIALLGLWRSKFFEKAAFYGGTALRILYGLDRFSEDIDFTLLKKDQQFSLSKYNEAIVHELNAFGFEVDVIKKNKNIDTNIESAFIKANTIKQLIAIAAPKEIIQYIHRTSIIKIKMEIDTDPPLEFSTEVKPLLLPIPFTVLTMKKEDLFAGKIHALLCRKWQKRIKGRDWYDFYWYISRNVPVNLNHLKARLVQSGHWEPSHPLTRKDLLQLLYDKIETIDFDSAKADVTDFLKDKQAIDLWSKSFFCDLIEKIQTQ